MTLRAGQYCLADRPQVGKPCCTQYIIDVCDLCKSTRTCSALYRITRIVCNVPGGGVTFAKIVRGCACRTSKILLSLYEFFGPITHPLVYHFQ